MLLLLALILLVAFCALLFRTALLVAVVLLVAACTFLFRALCRISLAAFSFAA